MYPIFRKNAEIFLLVFILVILDMATGERDFRALYSDLDDKYKKLQATHKSTEDELRVARYEVDSLKGFCQTIF